jgi:beta-lactamase class D
LDKDFCYLLYNLKTNKLEEVFNDERCKREFGVTSTIKVPLAIIAFEEGLLKERDNIFFKWKGVPDSNPLHQDQTPETWMRKSVVWVSAGMIEKSASKNLLKKLYDINFLKGPKPLIEKFFCSLLSL